MKIGDIVKSAVSGKRFIIVPNIKHAGTNYWALRDTNDMRGPLRYARADDVRMCYRDRLTPSDLSFDELLKHVVK